MKKSHLNQLYGRVLYFKETLNEPLKTPKYTMMNALLKGLFSHAASLIKLIMLDNNLSLGAVKNAKRMIEYYALLEWLKKQNDTVLAGKRFFAHYDLKRYEMALQYSDYDDVLFDLKTLKSRYDVALELFRQSGIDIKNGSLPFTNDTSLDYETLIENNLSNQNINYLADYRYLSLLDQPHNYGSLKQLPQLYSIYYKVLIIVDLLTARLKDKKALNDFETIREERITSDKDREAFYQAMKAQSHILTSLKAVFKTQYKRHIMCDFLDEIMALNEDAHTDFLLDFGGQMKSKWGRLIEIIALFNHSDNHALILLKMHTDYQKVLTFNALSEQREQLLEKAFDHYQSRYKTDYTVSEFETAFKKPNGFFLDGALNVTSIQALTLALLKQQFKTKHKDMTKKPEDLLAIAYQESILFDAVLASHSDLEAVTLREAQNTLFAVDHLIMAMLYSVQRRYQYALKKNSDEMFEKIVTEIKQRLKEYFEATNVKHMFFKKQMKPSFKSDFVQ